LVADFFALAALVIALFVSCDQLPGTGPAATPSAVPPAASAPAKPGAVATAKPQPVTPAAAPTTYPYPYPGAEPPAVGGTPGNPDTYPSPAAPIAPNAYPSPTVGR
jgi:hypothetical protein